MDLTLAGDLLAAGSALSGLVLVFLGGILNAYEGYEEVQRPAVRGLFQRRAWAGFAGFALSLAGTLLAVMARVFHSSSCIWMSALSLAVALVILLIMALIEVRGI